MAPSLARVPKTRSFWTAHAVFWGAYLAIIYLALLPVSPLPAGTLFLNKLGWAVVGAMLTAALRPLYRRLLHGSPVRAATCVIGTCCVVALGWLSGYALLIGWSSRGELPSSRLVLATYGGLLSVLLVWSLGFMGASLWSTAAAERWARADAERLRREAELEALRHPLNPHFLFNALASIRALVAEDAARARFAITQLAELLRDSLQASAADEVRLIEEVRACRRYLDLELIRFEDKLRVTCEADPATHDCYVPVFSLRAMVENAIKHGRPIDGVLEIGLRTHVQADGLTVVVTNSGALSGSGANGNGGLRNLRERLARLRPDAHSLTLTERDGTVIAELWLSDAVRR